MTRIGLISDTHGLLRPQVLELFAGVDRILHAGDVEDPDILIELGAVAPVSAVWGNVDGWDVREVTAERQRLEVEGVVFHLVHGHQYPAASAEVIVPAIKEADVVVFGHSHRPEIVWVGGRLAINPGSAGPRRFTLPVTVAIVEVDGAKADARIVDLELG